MIWFRRFSCRLACETEVGLILEEKNPLTTRGNVQWAIPFFTCTLPLMTNHFPGGQTKK